MPAFPPSASCFDQDVPHHYREDEGRRSEVSVPIGFVRATCRRNDDLERWKDRRCKYVPRKLGGVQPARATVRNADNHDCQHETAEPRMTSFLYGAISADLSVAESERANGLWTPRLRTRP